MNEPKGTMPQVKKATMPPPTAPLPGAIIKPAPMPPVQTVVAETVEVATVDNIHDLDMRPTKQDNSQAIEFHQFEGTDISKMAGQFKKGSVTLGQEYWTPETIGEERLSQFLGYKWMTLEDGKSLETAVFAHEKAGKAERFSNASKVLLGQMQDNNVSVGDVLYITYKGKKSSKDGKRQMDTWEIVPAVPK